MLGFEILGKPMNPNTAKKLLTQRKHKNEGFLIVKTQTLRKTTLNASYKSKNNL